MKIDKIILDAPLSKVYEEKSIKDSKNDDSVKIIAKMKILEKESKGNKYFMLIFDDKTESLSSAIWNSSSLYPLLDLSLDGELVAVEGTVKISGKYKNIVVDGLCVMKPEPEDATLFETASADIPTIEELKIELNKRVSRITDTYLKKLVIIAIKNNEDKITNAPFSEKTAYAYRGGLLHQIVDMCDMVTNVCDTINSGFWAGSTLLNEDLLLTGAILSNLGKADALTFNSVGEIEKTSLGIMEEDSVLSRDAANTAVRETMSYFIAESSKTGKAFNEKYYNTINMEVLHMVSSVKNNTSWGALSSPRSKNAMILSNINNMVYTKGLFESIEKNTTSGTFTKAYEAGKQYYIGDKLE